jgi:hypothetical protein
MLTDDALSGRGRVFFFQITHKKKYMLQGLGRLIHARFRRAAASAAAKAVL